MPNFNNQKMVFLGDTLPIISEILKKYELEDTDEDILGKIEQGKPCLLGGIIFDIVIEVVQGKISKKDLVSSLQKYLDIPKEKAKNIAKDIEERLLVLVKKAPKEKTEIPEKPPATKKPLKIEKTPIVEKPEIPPEKRETPEEPDVYREPIE